METAGPTQLLVPIYQLHGITLQNTIILTPTSIIISDLTS